MKKLLLLLVLLTPIFSIAQSIETIAIEKEIRFLNSELLQVKQEMKNLEEDYSKEKNNLKGYSSAVRGSQQASIDMEYDEQKTKIERKQQGIESALENLKHQLGNLSSNQKEGQRLKQLEQQQQYLNETRQRSAQANKQIIQSLDNTINSLMSSANRLQQAEIIIELNRRQRVTSNFVNRNSKLMGKLGQFYNSIPSENFNKSINGIFEAYLLFQKPYSFVNNQELNTVEPALVEVKDNKIIKLYPYGKKGLELNYPSKFIDESTLTNGMVEYNDYETLTTTTVALIEPYLSNNPKQYKIEEGGAGSVTLYTKRKKDAGKTVWIQEIDKKNDNVIRESSTKLVYVKNEKELESKEVSSIPVNTDYTIYYFGRPVERPWGRIPLFMKVSKKDTKPLKDGEKRFVQIKNYRE